MKSSKSIQQVLIMTSITLLIQLCTMIKTAQLASIFGVSIQMDAYNFTNNIASFILGFISTGVITVLIPAYVNTVNKAAINTFLTVVYGSILLISIIAFLGKSPLIGILTNRDDEFIAIASSLLPILLIYNFITASLSITTAFFQCQSRFYIEKMLLLLSNLGIVIILIFNKSITIIDYTISIAILSLINLVIQCIIAYKSGFKFYPQLKIKNTEFKNLINLFIPTIFSSGLYKLSLLIDSIVATNLEAGKLSILNYSNQLMNMINTLLIGNILTFIYPKIVRGIGERGFQKKFFNICIAFFLLMSIIVICFALVGNDILTLFFERGNFDSKLTKELYYCSYIYILGQPINITRDLIYRYFYANGDTKTTFRNSIFVSVFNMIISILLASVIGVYGVILGTVISSVLSLSMILLKFKKIFGFECDKFHIFRQVIIIIISSFIAIVSGKLISNMIGLKNIFVSIIFNSILGIFIFLLCLFTLSFRGIKNKK